MSIVNCTKHGKIIGENVCRHILEKVMNNKKNYNITKIKYEFFPNDKTNPFVEHSYCEACAEKYNIPDNLVITAESMESDVEPNMYEDAQEELTIVCPKCFDESLKN